MKGLNAVLIAVVASAAIFVYATSTNSSGGLQVGETVRPVVGNPTWRAGTQPELAIRLEAVNSETQESRFLAFTGIPFNKNPKAEITFYNDESLVAAETSLLNHRC